MSVELEQRLRHVALRLDVDVHDRLVRDVLERIAVPARPVATTRRRVLAFAAGALAATLIGVLGVPASRHAVARFFGIGSTRIERLPTPTTSAQTPNDTTPATVPLLPTATFPTSLDLGDPTTDSEATSLTGLGVPLVPTLGNPAGIFVVMPPANGQVVVAYAPSATLPATPVGGIGALLSAVRGVSDAALFYKGLGEGTIIEQISLTTAGGFVVPAIWLSGAPHQYAFESPNGDVVFDTLRLATNTLLWVVDGVQYRLESGLSREAAVDMAGSVVTSG